MPQSGDAPGYYEDPNDPSRIRYWTGTGWRDAVEPEPASENWQRRAYDAANSTHWLFASTDDAYERFHRGPLSRDPRRHHPSYGEAIAMCSGLIGMEGGGLFYAARGEIPWSWAITAAIPIAIGVGLSLYAAAWAARKNAAAGLADDEGT